jgi:hypothetical protein
MLKWVIGLPLGIALGLLIFYLLQPLTDGYHLGGCNALIDHFRIIRLGLEWCK